MSVSDAVQLGSLIIGGFTLYFLVKYVGYTKAISQQAVHQTEAAFKPAVIAVHRSINENPLLQNIGKGPALDIAWEITGTTKAGLISHLQVGDSEVLVLGGMRPLYDGALESGENKVSIRCTYKSISGTQYTSISAYDFENCRFSTSFSTP